MYLASGKRLLGRLLQIKLTAQLEATRFHKILSEKRGPRSDNVQVLLNAGFAGALGALLSAHIRGSSSGKTGASGICWAHESLVELWALESRGENCHAWRGKMEGINEFAPFKTSGLPDGILQALFQEGWDLIVTLLLKISRACLAISYRPISFTLTRLKCWEIG